VNNDFETTSRDNSRVKNKLVSNVSETKFAKIYLIINKHEIGMHHCNCVFSYLPSTITKIKIKVKKKTFITKHKCCVDLKIHLLL
jgi:hypothetical protein